MTEEAPLTVYPVAIETDDNVDVPEFNDETDTESTVVKIDKIDNNFLSTNNPVSASRPKSGFGSIITAIRIAKWMAKSYGYATQKKALYTPLDTVKSHCTLVKINWKHNCCLTTPGTPSNLYLFDIVGKPAQLSSRI